ncbi:substrate-binding periplasmic protein [Oceanospirillum linum]|uniref:Solute-binding protein family 3/N-terminal domain-containing protein n=1 Tax=Oceanospirillum linum TaxID=966 RepID=A0A1T1HE66_OCELI|nr:transporter substrate-binding domain-containing protein [Oceanospirillum linum]OOV88113.1 hypothetical protein BTA35_0200735 [Oceanospirillum linum]SEF43520.1 amino acid ABC transporter substrate-binding protein, PAAT family [Oleiphilus messinensis]SMP01327.1 amino acid ABC transporter substrate-binding protein, PAAT family [Oceanospirillum linum]
MTIRHLLHTLLLALLISSATKAAAQTLRIGTDNWPPFRHIKEHQVTGIDNDLWQQLSKKLSIKIQYVHCPWKRCLDLMKTGDIDAMSGLAWQQERGEYIHYIKPAYFGCSTRFYVRRGEEKRLQNREQLNHLNIGMVRGSAYYTEFDQNNTLQKTQLTQESVLLPLLASGRIDSYIGTDCQADFELARSSWYQQLVKAPFNPESNTPLYIGLSKKSDWNKNSQSFSEAIQQVLANGFRDAMQQKYYQSSE